MMQTNSRDAAFAFFHDRLGLHWSEDFRGVLWVPEEYAGEIASMDHVAVAIGYGAFIGRSCAMHIVIQRPDLFSARIIREAFEFPFVVCNCEAALALIDSENTASLDFCARVGFEEIARVPHGGPDGDLVITQMTRAGCRWLRKPH